MFICTETGVLYAMVSFTVLETFVPIFECHLLVEMFVRYTVIEIMAAFTKEAKRQWWQELQGERGSTIISFFHSFISFFLSQSMSVLS